MNSMIALSFLLLFNILSYSEAWVGLKPLLPNPDYPGQCYDPEGINGVPLIMDPGDEIFPEGECLSITCSNGGGQLSLTGCGVVAGPPGCEVVQDLSLQFPKCCPTIKCPDRP